MNRHGTSRDGHPRVREDHALMVGRHHTLAILLIASTLIAMLSVSVAWADNATAMPSERLVRNVQNGPVELTVTLSRGKAQIAEPLMLTLTARAPSGVTITFPPNSTMLGSFNVLQVSDTPDVPTRSGREWTRQYRLESLVAGKQTIPPVSVAYVDRRQTKSVSDVVSSPELELTITSMLEGTPDPLKFRDIKDVVDFSTESQPLPAWIAWSFAGAFVLTLLGVALVVWPKRASRVSPSEWAMTELTRLERDDLIATGHKQDFYFRLTDIVRQYIEQRFDIAAPKLTTAEFLGKATRHASLNERQQLLLHDLLSRADLVKFARFEPTVDIAQQAIASAREFIRPETVEEKA